MKRDFVDRVGFDSYDCGFDVVENVGRTNFVLEIWVVPGYFGKVGHA